MAERKRTAPQGRAAAAADAAEGKREQKSKVTDISGYRRRKRRVGNTRWVRLLLFFIVCMVAGYFFALSPLFSVGKIVVKGNTNVSADSVIQSSGIHKGDNIFAVSARRTEQWAKINYMVAEAKVEKKLPRTVVIEIVERVPAALVPVVDGFLQIDKYGVVTARLRETDKPVIPFITGLGGPIPAGTVPGTRISVDNIATALAVLEQMDAQSAAFITEIDVSNAQKIVLYTADNTQVRIGSSEDFQAKFEALYAILKAQEQEGLLSSIAYLDVSLVSNPAIFYSK